MEELQIRIIDSTAAANIVILAISLSIGNVILLLFPMMRSFIFYPAVVVFYFNFDHDALRILLQGSSMNLCFCKGDANEREIDLTSYV